MMLRHAVDTPKKGFMSCKTPTTIGIEGVAGPGTQKIRGSTSNNQCHAATRSVL